MCQMASKFVERFKQCVQCTNVTDDRQTDHATEKCVAIGEKSLALRERFHLKTLKQTNK